MSPRRTVSIGAKKVALIAIMTATIEAGKLALAAIPNVEVVSLLCAVYGYVFGLIGVVSIVLFVGIETLIWGVNTWVLSYLIYWPLVCIIYWWLGKIKVRSRLILTAVIVALTAFFGVLTSLVDVGLFSGFWDNFWQRFVIYYGRGIVFYIVQIVCNAIVFPLLFLPLAKVLTNFKNKFFNTPDVSLPLADNKEDQ
ncbi:MAG: hypothetical protein ACI4MI_06165 [Christensenellales bacterium]